MQPGRDLPIVDAHLHLWDPRYLPVPWLPDGSVIDAPHDLEAFVEATRGLEVAAMVYVQVEVPPAFALLEAPWALARANRDPRLQGIVAYAPLEYGMPARAYLDALAKLGSRIKGVRRNIQDEPDPGFALRPEFLDALRLLPAYDYSFDVCIRHEQLSSVVEMARRCPETRFVLDHLGKPAIKDHRLDPWRSHLRALAALPNAWCKISGLVTEAGHERWTPDDLRPYVEHALDVFGEERVLFGSDWPVQRLASTYQRWVETLDRLSEHLSESARRRLWAENARSFYRLGALPL